MLFNTTIFFTFFVTVFGLYVLLPHRWQNRLLLAASYIFYGSWDWRFLFLIAFTTAADFIFARRIHAASEPRPRRLWLLASVAVNIAVLGFFKYCNFFVQTAATAMQSLGLHPSVPVLEIALPVGISFYTFKTLSYTVDVYRGKMVPTANLADYALYVAFFPQILAGPIDRAVNLLPQISVPRRVTSYGLTHGGYLVLWGLFQKVFVADNLARLVDPRFSASGPYNGMEVLIAVYAYAFQLYCDFAACTNISRGLGLAMGFRTPQNFNLPYFSTNPSEFWRRWHISLSSWLRDYVYIPLGGNREGTGRTYLNLMLTMLIGGLWHGAAWTFVLWGAFHGAMLVVHRWYRERVSPWVPAWRPAAAVVKVVKMAFFFNCVCLGWLLFRATSIGQAWEMFTSVFLAFDPQVRVVLQVFPVLFCCSVLAIVDIWQYVRNDPYVILRQPLPVRVAIYLVLVYAMVLFGVNDAQSFIYQQF
jgi:D-alanyl-lipoteichoic acid acyltransferase DltB (MBOAT superfamily)